MKKEALYKNKYKVGNFENYLCANYGQKYFDSSGKNDLFS